LWLKSKLCLQLPLAMPRLIRLYSQDHLVDEMDHVSNPPLH
jgi:hypothetical protein